MPRPLHTHTRGHTHNHNHKQATTTTSATFYSREAGPWLGRGLGSGLPDCRIVELLDCRGFRAPALGLGTGNSGHLA